MCLHSAFSHTTYTSMAPPYRLEHFRVTIALSNNHVSECRGVYFPAAAWWEATLEPETKHIGEQGQKFKSMV